MNPPVETQRHVYHLAPLSEFRTRATDRDYTPLGFTTEGFIHCATHAQLLPVADDYFAGADEPVLVLELDATAFGERLVYEAPAPLPGAGTAHLLEGKLLFPHLYAPIPLASVTRAAPLARADGAYAWPDAWSPHTAWLRGD